jgi:WD repeat-containing protein 45
MNLASNRNELLYANFNQDHSCFAVGVNNGFAVFNAIPFKETFRRIFSNGGIGIVEMLYRCNLLALVGGGANPRYHPNKVMIWDDHQNRCVGELMFKNPVFAVRLRRDRIAVVLQNRVYYYRFKDLKLLLQIPTCNNTKGLIALCPEDNCNILAVPALNSGDVRIDLFDMGKVTTIKTHSSDLAQITLSKNGSLLATCSDKGTLIRLWNTSTGDLLKELRRGTDRAEIFCLAFNMNASYLACTSDKGTLHIFHIEDSELTQASMTTSSATNTPGRNNNTNGEGGEAGDTCLPIATSATSNLKEDGNEEVAAVSMDGTPSSVFTSPAKTSKNSSMKGLDVLKNLLPSNSIPKYFHSEWSYAQLRGIEGRAICAFDETTMDNHRISVLDENGIYTLADYSLGGECDRIACCSVLENRSADKDDHNSVNDDTMKSVIPQSSTIKRDTPSVDL